MHPASRSWSDLGAILLLVVVVSTIYGARLGRQPAVGEETRWANGAREMMASGDWIVPRQQGRVFPERPPMSTWAMALVGTVRGKMDAIAIRLPSVVAVVLTSLLIYGYSRAFLSVFAALAAALAYATFGQVLQIGRMGESEALFTLFVSASLLLWHLGYIRQWPPLATWSVGFGCASLAALVKGPQAPVYFVAITAVCVAVRRDWRFLLSWQYAAGAAVFVAIIAAWQIPFYLATDWDSVMATWAGLAADRFHLSGFAAHVVIFPLETFACLLPWSPLLVALAKRETRELFDDQRPLVMFLAIALAVAYPTVWIAAGARGRYFMPLYPLVAVLVGLVIDRCSTGELGRYPRRAWHQFLLLTSTLVATGGVVIGGMGMLPTDWADTFQQPRWFSIAFGLAAAATVCTLWMCYRARAPYARMVAVVTIAVFVGAAYTGFMINLTSARWNDPTAAVARFKQLIPPTAPLVSLTAIEHRFAYYYESPIAELDWPERLAELPPDVDYFCFMRNPGDTAWRRKSGRGRRLTTTSAALPFAWEELATLCTERTLRDKPQRIVVLGRVIRPIQAIASDATVPQRTSIDLTAAIGRDRRAR